HQDKSHRFVGNLIAPAIYTLVEGLIEGAVFFSAPHHLAYWIFSLGIGFLQEMSQRSSGLLADICMILEHVLRTCILLAMYGIFEIITEQYSSIASFLDNDSHLFVTIVFPLLGLIIGFTNMLASHYLQLLKKTACQLEKYSEWFLGKELLSAAITNANTLSLQRRKRAVLFIDIRGFTRWSEDRSPEVVVNMLNAYFETAEQVFNRSKVIKNKYTADEIMAIFPAEQHALHNAVLLHQEINTFLKKYTLSAGIGIHYGYLVEGLIGSKKVKTYDVIGDTVNTAKRICDQAKGGEILISEELYTRVARAVLVREPRCIQAKGKSEPVKVFPIQVTSEDKKAGF
ncbi:MAG: adenylate/guanylate cyclase domain-containing protein, partial [Candidatus Electrothrix sp. AR3]|nr:adenylate/guanylate cyclase domain-containing protein [Candidatus Electrothrix sp. AR3]